jgi:hypothetical protein
MLNAYFPLRGHTHNTIENGCGVPVDCCCGGGNIFLRQNELNSSFFSFENFLRPLENGIKYNFVSLIYFKISDMNNVLLAELTPAQLSALDSITSATPLVAGVNNFTLEQIKIFSTDKPRGIRIRHNTNSLAVAGSIYKFEYKVKLKSQCDEGLIVEIPDCAMAQIVKC